MSSSRYLKMITVEINHDVVMLGIPYYLHVEKKGKFAKAVTTVVTSVPEGVRPVDLCCQPQIPDVLLTDIDQFIVWCRDEGLLPLESNGGPSVRLMAKKLDKSLVISCPQKDICPQGIGVPIFGVGTPQRVIFGKEV